jgi:hypothetical protein
MCMLHSNGIHKVAINYYGCSCALPQHIQLLQHWLYPSTQLIITTCTTFKLLELLHKFALTTKASTIDFYHGLERLMNNAGIGLPKNYYWPLFRMVMQWRHLKLLKWAGRGHDLAKVDATEPGQLAIKCLSCPYHGINLLNDFESVPTSSLLVHPCFQVSKGCSLTFL